MRKKLLAAAVMGAVGAVTGICMAGAADAAYVLDEVAKLNNFIGIRHRLTGFP